jgi:hypothetical protein
MVVNYLKHIRKRSEYFRSNLESSKTSKIIRKLKPQKGAPWDMVLMPTLADGLRERGVI